MCFDNVENNLESSRGHWLVLFLFRNDKLLHQHCAKVDGKHRNVLSLSVLPGMKISPLCALGSVYWNTASSMKKQIGALLCTSCALVLQKDTGGNQNAGERIAELVQHAKGLVALLQDGRWQRTCENKGAWTGLGIDLAVESVFAKANLWK